MGLTSGWNYVVIRSKPLFALTGYAVEGNYFRAKEVDYIIMQAYFKIFIKYMFSEVSI